MTRSRAQGIETVKAEPGIPQPMKIERSEINHAPQEAAPDLSTFQQLFTAQQRKMESMTDSFAHMQQQYETMLARLCRKE